MARNIGEPIIINTDNKTKLAKSKQTRKRNIGEPIILSDSSILNQVQLPSVEDLVTAGPKGASKLLGDNLKKQVQSKTTIPSVNYDESYVKHKSQDIPLFDKVTIAEIQKKISNNKALNQQEREILSKYGFNVLSSGDTLKTIDFLADNNTVYKNYENTLVKLINEKESGKILTPEDNDMLETAKMLSSIRKDKIKELSNLSRYTSQNGYNKSVIGATVLYDDAAYGENTETNIGKDKRTLDRTKLYLNTGFTGYFQDTFDSASVLIGYVTGNSEKVKKEISERADSPYELASSALREYYSRNGQQLNKVIQDTVTNMANNAIPMLLSIAGASGANSAALNASKTALEAGKIASRVSRVISTVSFAPSVFGNAYKEGLKSGITEDGKLLLYSFATTAAECGLEMALGSTINPAGGVLSGEIISNFSEKFNSVLIKSILKIVGNGAGEFVEEGIQSILGPLFKEWFLGTDETTIFDDPIGTLSNAAYEGFVGFLSSIFMSGFSSIQSARSETAIQANGKLYKSIAQQTNTDIKDIAQFIKESIKDKSIAKTADKVLKGDISDMAVGEFISQVHSYSEESGKIFFSNIGQNIVGVQNGVNMILSVYEETIKKGAIYPEKVTSIYEKVKENLANGDINTNDVGEFAYYVEAYSPKAHILGEVTKAINKSNSPSAPSNSLSEAEQKILDTPDSQLTPEQRAVKQTILERQQKNITQNGDVYSGNIIDISADNELSELLGNLQRTEKYRKIKEYILGILGGRKITLSDGKNAVVDGRDAQHIASNAGTKKIAQISKITEIINKSKLVAEEDSTKAKKFDYFYYYEILVKDGKEIYPIYLNVGRARNDGSYHIYDITQKLRDTAHRVNDVWRPVGNAIENGISNNTVPQKAQTVNNNISNSEQNNTQADFSESANFMPESDESGTEENRPTFREASGREIARPETAEEQMNTIIGRHENIQQRQLKDVAKKLGVKIRWDTECVKGYFDPETNTIVMNPMWTLTKGYYTLFKHEFVHFLETRKAYESFKNYLLKISRAFEDYVRTQVEDRTGKAFTGSREEAIAAYTDIVMNDRKSATDIPDRIKKGYNTEKIHREIIADFVAERLLGEKDIKKSEQALLEIADTNRNLLQRIIDWVKDKISILKVEARNRTLVEDLEYLNQRLARVYDSAQKRGANKGEISYSIVEPFTDNSGNYYDNAVLLDTDFFKGLSPRNWGSKLKEYVYNRSEHSPFIMDIIDENGNVQKLQFARTNDRVTKDGQSNHKVIDELSRGSDNISKLSVIHIDEIVEVSEENNPYYTAEHKHQWLDENGWLHRNAYVIRKTDGAIFNLTFDIAKSKDGRTILYTTRGKIKKVGNVQVDSLEIRGPGLNTNFGKSVTQNKPIVNRYSMQNNMENFSDKKFAAGSPEFTAETKRLSEAVKNGEITVDEFVSRINELVENEHKVSEDARTALEEQKKLHEDYVVDSARYMAQQKKRIKRQNEQLAKRRSEISAEITAQREERATKQKNIESIRKTVSRIDKMFRTNSNTKHVPEDLKEAAGILVKIFLDNDVSPFDKRDLRDIRTLYGDLIGDYNIFTGEGETTVSAFDPEILNDLRTLEKRLNGKTLRELDYYDTLLVRNIVDNFAQIIKNENEMFLAGKEYEVDEVGSQALRDLSMQKSKRENGVTKSLDSMIKFGNMTPIYFFNRIGGVFKTLFDDVLNAQNKWYRNVENSKAYIRQMKEKYNYSQWDNDTFKFTTEKGEEIEITREQALLLYATARRENKNKFQRAEHLFRGGVVIPPSPNTVKSILKKYSNSKSKGISKITDAMTEEINSRAHRILPQDIAKIMNWLTDEQVQYANAMVEYLSKDMAALGNEVSLKLFGITKYNEDYYIPYNSAQNYLYSQPGVTNEARLKHQSFTKNTVVGANNPLVLSDFSEVCADHINRMCMYNAFTIPLENMNKIFNYSTPSTADKNAQNVKVEIERVYGTSAVNYIKQFLLDMNGNVRTSGTDKLINRWISKFKKGAVFASASVVVQQPSAIIRAMAYINPKYFAKTALSVVERDYQQAVQYASVAGIKEMGRFDTGVGASTTNWLLHETPKGFMNKVKALVDTKDSTYRDDKLSFFAAKADEITWAHIWAATKAEIVDTTDLKPGTKEFFEACGERFSEVINYTQVYDSTISRSQLMRDKSTGAQMLTAFMSEPTVSLNLLMNAVHQAKTDGKNGRIYAARAVGALVGNVVLNALLKSIITAGRDDDEDKTYLEKYIGEFSQNFASDINPLKMLPFVRDIISIFEGYTVERADMNLFSDLAQSVKYLQSENKTTYEKIESFAGSLAAFLGLPVKNVLRDIRTVYNLAEDFKRDILDDTLDTDLTGIRFAISGESNSGIFEKLVRAAEEDNEEEYQRIYKYLIDEGKDVSDIKSGIKKVYKNSAEVKSDTKKYLNKLQENKTFDNLSDDDKEKFAKDISSILATQKTVKAVEKKPDRFDNLYTAYRTNKNKYKKLRQELLNEGMTDGQIADGLEVARIAYMKSQGIDIHEYLLYKISVSKKYADTDNSGGVSKKEKQEAVIKMDSQEKTKNYFLRNYK